MTANRSPAVDDERRSANATRTAVLGALYSACGHDDDVDVQVERGVVQLTGRVRAIENRDRVIRAAHGVPGVVVVLDDIVLGTARTPLRADHLIAADVLHLLAGLPSLPVDRLRARVHEGVVVVTGTITRTFQRDTVLNLLGAIRGVADVVDAVRVVPDHEDPHAASTTTHHRPDAFVD
ncbi:BON domain-containing protein [Amnibacterium kyonggiense]|uniref:BON domain-containing protein n=1 Tax=Amnibacterium kyonggiense TaxID=595671 RepID=A0A4R7FKE8_9MICO|nr:BON domain-containing protein [Amnibacterium kyonggiense]TDS76830.1 BON domain-containing protein [Amnibacterium kyonggiense]